MLSVALPYHLKVRDHFKQQQETWNFFAAAGTKEEQPQTNPLISDKAVTARELARVKLFSLLDGDLEVADRIITAIANNNGSIPPYMETARLFRLYTEIWCDREVYAVLGDITPVIPATGTHPENIIRTRALQLWQEKKDAAEEEITRMIEGLPELDRLDIFSQKELAALTRDFLQVYLRPKWFQSTPVIRLAREYFPDLSLDEPAFREEQQTDTEKQPDYQKTQGRLPLDEPALSTEQLTARIAPAHPSIKEYFAYILLDFALADPSLEEMPSGRAFRFAEEMQLSAAYDPIVQKELQLSDKKWSSCKEQALAAYAAIKED